MSLIREIENAATESKIDISTVLRKAKILAARLQNPEFEIWVDRELNGYDERSSLPPYRILRVEVHGHIRNRSGLHWNDAPIMTSFLPEHLKDLGEKSYCNQPIAIIASMAAEADSGNEIRAPWPQELAVKFGAKGYNGFECLGAWQVISPTALVGLVETVRNRILEFVLKIEAQNPDAGEAPPNSQPVSPDKVQMIFNNVFNAPVGNVAQNSEHLSQTASMEIQPQDLTRLVTELSEHLEELNLGARQKQRADAQIATLKAELAGEEPDSSIVSQAGRTLRSITESAIGSLLAAAATEPTVWQWIRGMLARF
jgi:hypothetical protein